MIVEAYEGALRSAGFEVGVCAGPSPGEPCPLVTARACPLVAGADLVLCGLDLAEPEIRAVLEALRTHHGGARVVVQVPDDQLDRLPASPGPIQVVPTSIGAGHLVALVEDLLASR